MHGSAGLDIFGTRGDARLFLERLGDVAARHALEVHAYCLMRTHYHLLVRDTTGVISAVMKDLNGWYARRFNLRHSRRGPVFDRRFYRELIEDDDQLRTCLRYIVRNPVTAELCEDPADWQWSSHRATVGVAPCPTFLRTDVALGPSGSVASYLALVDASGLS